MNAALVDLIAEGILAAIKAAEGQLTKEDVVKAIEDAMTAASDAEMAKEFPNG